MSECDFSDHPVSVMVVIVMNFLIFLTYLNVAARISFKFCVGAPWVDLYQICENHPYF